MKSSKKLMIVLLVLAIVTALSAGTLAIYTTTIDKATTTTVTAKSYVFTTGKTFQDVTAISLAPGENTANDKDGKRTVNYQLLNYDEKATSEVPMTVTITPEFATDLFDVYPGLKITLNYREGKGNNGNGNGNGNGNAQAGSITWTKENISELRLPSIFTANEKNSIDCTLNFEWPDSGASNNTSIGKASTMSLKFVSTQNVDASPVNPEV